MFWKKYNKTDRSVKNLSEKDIQRQLYGNYLDRVEVMDSSFLLKEMEEVPIRERFDEKAKKELKAELEGLKGEFKRLKGEVNRLRKDKESLERSEIWFKPPFLKAKHLVIIGSLVVLIAVASISFLAIKFFFSKVGHKEASLSSISSEKAVTKKEAPPKVTAKKPAKKVIEKKLNANPR